jgi:dienelactone hydrolase
VALSERTSEPSTIIQHFFLARDAAATQTTGMGAATSSRLAWSLTLALLAAGCTAHVHYPYRAASDAGQGSGADSPVLEYDRRPISYRNHVLESDPTRAYQVRHIKMRSIGENGQKDDNLEAFYYQSNRPGKRPLVIVLPIWGAKNYPPKKFASALRSRSGGEIHVLRVLGEDYVFDWEALGAARTEEEFLGLMDRMLQRDAVNALDVSRLIDWAEARPEVDPTRIGMIAFSHSAIVGGTVAVNETRLQATVLVMGGAYVHKILATCAGRIGALRETITARFGWTAQDYERSLEPIFMRYDPTRFPGRADPSRILMIEAGNDECVPPASREDFWKALGKPELYSLKYNHKSSFLSMTPLGSFWMQKKVYEFLANKLEIDPDPSRN